MPRGRNRELHRVYTNNTGRDLLVYLLPKRLCASVCVFVQVDRLPPKKENGKKKNYVNFYPLTVALTSFFFFSPTMIRKRKLHCQNNRIRIGKGPMGTTIITQCKKISQVMQTKCGTIGLTVHTQLKSISRNSVSIDKRSVWFIRRIQRNLYGQMAQVGNFAFCYTFRVCFDSTLGDQQQPNSKAVQNSCNSRPFFNLIPVPTFPFCLPNLTRWVHYPPFVVAVVTMERIQLDLE